MEIKTREWAVFDRNGILVCMPVCGETPRSVVIDGGVKIPFDHLWMRADSDCTALLGEAKNRAEAADIEQLWRAAAGAETITPAELATRTGADDTLSVLTVLQIMLDNPGYFRRREGRFAPANETVLDRVRASLKRRAEDAAAEQLILDEIAQSTEPPQQLTEMRGELLARENKNSVMFRAAKKAAGGENRIPEWLVKVGACADASECWSLLFEHHWAPCPPDFSPSAVPDLPPAAAEAFSVDEAGTFEVDDAFSVRESPGGDIVVGIHIAAPALEPALFANDNYHARRLTSVYFPGGDKRPMLPPSLIDFYSLRTGDFRAAVSLYCHYDRKNGILGRRQTCVDRVRIKHNFTPEDFANGAPKSIASEYELLREFAALLPPVPGGNRTEYRIRTSPPAVDAVSRPYIGMVVEKMMRLVNGEWGAQIAESGGGLFRTAGALSTRPDRTHIYAWTSSPLRRYPDMANQRLLLSIHGMMPPPPVHWRKLAREYSLQQMRARHFQDMMERHWVLRALETLPSGVALRAKWMTKNKIRLCDYPMSGLIINPAGGKIVRDEELTVRLQDIDIFMQRAWFARI